MPVHLIKPVAAAVTLVLVISVVAIYILPQYIYISPLSKFYNSGVVDHRTLSEGNPKTYTVSIRLLYDDPLNHISGGETLAYIVSKEDWDMVKPQDTVKIEMLPNAQAKILEVIPVSGVIPDWRLNLNSDLPLEINFTADKQNYKIGETAYFSIRLINNATLDETPKNITLYLFEDCRYFIFNNKLVSTNDDFPAEIQNKTLEPNQEVVYTFSWDILNLVPGNYEVRVFAGYFATIETASLTQTILIGVSK
jgi:hypothetical protein